MSRRVLMMAAFAGLLWAQSDRGNTVSAAPEAPDPTGDALPPRTPGTRPKGNVSKPSSSKLDGHAGDGWWTTLGGLTAVLALVFLAAKVARKSIPTAHKTLPAEVVQVLGRKALDYRHTVHLVRFGSRLLMVGVSQEGMTTLSEINDPVEIDYLSGLCKPSDPTSVSQTFTQLFHRFQTAEPARTETDSEVEHEGEIESDGDQDAHQNSDPAILRLQERLHQSPRADLDAASVSFSPEVRG